MEKPIAMKNFVHLPVEIYADNESLGEAAAKRAAYLINSALAEADFANIIVATGNSQLTFYRHLVKIEEINWKRVRIFHMDEYVGMNAAHPASFRRYLREKFVDIVDPAAFFGGEGDAPDPLAECMRYTALFQKYPAHLCCRGLGENGHLAFNDPPYADFHDPNWVKIVRLAERSRHQQVGEGHFARLEDVPTQAITLTIPALLAARQVLAIVPEQRKAEAVKAALTGPITTDCPASILRTVPNVRLYLDRPSAALIM